MLSLYTLYLGLGWNFSCVLQAAFVPFMTGIWDYNWGKKAGACWHCFVYLFFVAVAMPPVWSRLYWWKAPLLAGRLRCIKGEGLGYHLGDWVVPRATTLIGANTLVNGGVILLLPAQRTMPTWPVMAVCASMVSGGCITARRAECWKHVIIIRIISKLISFYTNICFAIPRVDGVADHVLNYPSWAFFAIEYCLLLQNVSWHTHNLLTDARQYEHSWSSLECWTPLAHPFWCLADWLHHHVERHILFCRLLLCFTCRSCLTGERWLVPHAGCVKGVLCLLICPRHMALLKLLQPDSMEDMHGLPPVKFCISHHSTRWHQSLSG